MNMKTKAAVAGGLVLTVLLGALYWAGESASPPHTPRGAEAMTAEFPLGTEELEAEAAERTPVEVETAGTRAPGSGLQVSIVWRDNELPAADVGVLVWRPDERKRSGNIATTNSEGAARFTNMQPGQVRVSIDRMGANWDLEIREGKQETLEIDVPRAMDVRGIDEDPSGLGVAGAQVLVTHAGVAPQTLYPNITTEADGTFFLRSLGTKLIAARAEGYGTSDLAFARSAEGVDG